MNRAFKLYLAVHLEKVKLYNAEKNIFVRIALNEGTVLFCVIIGFFSLLFTIGLALKGDWPNSLMLGMIFLLCVAELVYAHYTNWRRKLLEDDTEDQDTLP